MKIDVKRYIYFVYSSRGKKKVVNHCYSKCMGRVEQRKEWLSYRRYESSSLFRKHHISVPDVGGDWNAAYKG